MPETYHFNKETGVHSLQFCLSVKAANQQEGSFSYVFNNGWGSFQIHCVKTRDTYVFSIKLGEDDKKEYSMFKSCSVKLRDGPWLAFNTIKILPNTLDRQYLATIHPHQFISKDQSFSIPFVLSSMDVAVPPLDPVDPVPTLGDGILDKLYKDETHDVFFIFDSSAGVATIPESGVTSDNISDSNVDARESSDRPQARDDDQSKSSEDNIQSNPDSSCRGTSDAKTTGAHKLVLCQWPYFKTMFESSFKEGGTGSKTIKIKDASSKAFRMLIRFMYTGKLPKDAQPTTVYMDPLNKHIDASWEALYLLAHRYDIRELTDFARVSILSKLNKDESVAFLFRTAYLFTDLREPVIKYAAQSCGSALASKSVRAEYLEHPESAELFGDLLEQMYAIKPVKS